jgi:hypothetical protein
VPAVLLEAGLHVADLILALEQGPQHQGGGGGVVLYQLTWHSLNNAKCSDNGPVSAAVTKRKLCFMKPLISQF